MEIKYSMAKFSGDDCSLSVTTPTRGRVIEKNAQYLICIEQCSRKRKSKIYWVLPL